MKLSTSLTKISKRKPPSSAARYTASLNFLQNIPSGVITGLTLSSSSSPEQEVLAVPRVNEPENQTTNLCPITLEPIVAKTVQWTSQSLAENCPISSVSIVKKEQGTRQSIEESCPIPSVPIVEKTKTSLDKEGKTKPTGSGNISVDGGKLEKSKLQTKWKLRPPLHYLDKKRDN